MLKLQRILRLLVCAVLVTTSFGCASTRTHESPGEYVDNTVITTKVKAAILNESSLKTMQISVKTYKDEVQLSGFVDSAESVAKAGEIARRVPGVGSVKNNLLVK
ncbi:BON domain-containing protein [Geomonas azotofigens]|uniref:BON domain-containing protein n=1 Tax=Geomonas azotofigens TaxID=2843196 RepID=UPI001C0F852E|nr:BON domain-containing protein [Geomonas azotofigens]MBU5614688.1 BON domain-containing protein [Geomonas azotofigens]